VPSKHTLLFTDDHLSAFMSWSQNRGSIEEKGD